ncbi:MAG: FesM [Alphaproteobacteria bacterium]|nr:FesM [Alphaproteobacteria bacterium]
MNAPAPQRTDLLAWPVLGRFLRWRHARLALQLPLFLLAVVTIGHGLAGPQLAPKNLATLLVWVHYRGLLVMALLVAGNVFCMACPFLLPRELSRRLLTPRWRWPHRLRSKWLALALFVAALFVYEWLDLWGHPFGTAVLALVYFGAALAVDGLFQGGSFCKYVCPIGQFNFAASTMSPLEVQARDLSVCASCTTHDCIKGARDPQEPARIVQRGCELSLFIPQKTGNLDCTFCMDCVHACPHDNIGLLSRLPGEALWQDQPRSGIGRVSRRRDLSALMVLFTFGALLNAFGMVSPVYAVQAWLAGLLGTTHELPVLAILFAAVLVVEPVVLMGGAAAWTRRATGSADRLVDICGRFAPVLLPLGVAVWMAHYGFHLFTGFLTPLPVFQTLLADLGLPVQPHWGAGGLPASQVYPAELFLLALGLLGSIGVAWRVAEREHPARTAAAFVPWATLCALLWAAAMWLLSQPMEMRGTFLGG